MSLTSRMLIKFLQLSGMKGKLAKGSQKTFEEAVSYNRKHPFIMPNDHRAIYEQFVKDNGIDLSDMSSFSFRTAEDFVAQYKRYPYDDFDNAYYALPPLDEIVAGYLRGLLA